MFKNNLYVLVRLVEVLALSGDSPWFMDILRSLCKQGVEDVIYFFYVPF